MVLAHICFAKSLFLMQVKFDEDSGIKKGINVCTEGMNVGSIGPVSAHYNLL